MWFVMLFAAVITWAVHGAVSIVLWVFGWPICLWMVLRSNVEEIYVSTFGRTLLEWSPYWAWRVYGNDEDGIDGLRGGDPAQAWWLEETKNAPDRWRIIKWSCWRNPMGNLRFIPPFGFIVNPQRVDYIGNSVDPDRDYDTRPGIYWYFAWHGLYTGVWGIVPDFDLFKWKRCHLQIRIGWKIIPRDLLGISPTDYRSKGCGFACQFQVK
jgi:hypothetical protein